LHQRHRTRNFIWPAAQARPVPLLFRFFPGTEERDVAPQRPPRRARGPAIDMCGAHGQHEAPIGSGIACQRCPPVSRGRMCRNVLCKFSLCVAHVHTLKIAQAEKQIYPESMGQTDGSREKTDRDVQPAATRRTGAASS